MTTAATFFLSPLNAEKAGALRQEFDNVRVMASNQEVVDSADIVFLSVLPDAAEGIVSALAFRPDQHVVSLISVPVLADLTAWIGPCRTLTRVIPETFIERHTGPILVYPGTPEVVDLFDGMGEVIVLSDEHAFNVAQTASCVMGPFYYLADQVVRWAERHGLPRELAARYVFSQFETIAGQGLRTDADDLSRLWEEMTPGGLNESVIRTVREDGAFDSWLKGLDIVLERIG